MKKQILIISIISLFAIILSADQKYKDRTPEENCPIIDQFPDVFKRYNIKNTIYRNRIIKIPRNKRWNIEDHFSKEFIKEYATNFINIFLFYSDIEGNGKFHQYYRYGKPGRMLEETIKLGHPYNYFLPYCHGFVLAEVIKDTILPRPPYTVPGKSNNYVLFAKVVDDIFNTIEEETIIIRHDFKIEKEKNVKLFFSVTIGPGVVINDINLRAYAMMGLGRPREEMTKTYPPRFPSRKDYAYVIDGIITDPYDAYNIKEQKYSDFKKELRQDAINIGIHK